MRYNLLSVALYAMFAFAGPAVAQTYTWDATGNTSPGNTTIEDGAGTWDTALTNWTTDGGATNVAYIPGETSNVIIGAGGAAGGVTVSNGGSPISVGNLTFGPATTGYNISGDGLDFTTTAPATTRTITLNRNATISGPIKKLSGNGNLTLSAVGANRELTLSADNGSTLTNDINVGGEVFLRLNHQNAAGNSGKISLNGSDARLILGGTLIAGGSSFDMQKNIVVTNTGNDKIIQMAGGTTNKATLSGTITINENANDNFHINPNGNGGGNTPNQILTISGKITGSGLANNEIAININQNGVVELSNPDNDFTGRIRLRENYSRLYVSHSGALPSTTRVQLNDTGTLVRLANGVTTPSGAALDVENRGNANVLELAGGTSNKATWGGPIVITENASANFTVNPNGSGGGNTPNQILTLAGNISGNGMASNEIAININQNGVVELSGTNNTFRGRIRLNENWSRLYVSDSGALPNTTRVILNDSDTLVQLADGVTTPSGAFLDVNDRGGNKTLQLAGGSSNTATWGGGIVINEQGDNSFDVNPNGSGTGAQPNQVLTLAGNISGSGMAENENAIDITGNGVVELSGTNNTFRGRVRLSAENATLLISDSGAIPSAATTSARVILNETDTTVLLGNGVTTPANADLTVNTTGDNKTLQLESGTATWAGGIKIDETGVGYFDVDVPTSGTLTISGAITGAGGAGLTKIGDGTLVLSGTSTYTGRTLVSDGTLDLSGTGAIYTGAHQNGTSWLTVDDGATLIVDDWSYGASNALGLLSSAAVTTLVDGGTVQYTGGDVDTWRGFSIGPDGATLEANNSVGEWSMRYGGDTTRAIVATGNGDRTLTLGGTGAGEMQHDLADPTTGTLGVTKEGASTWTLTGDNTYSGDTTVSAGTLQVGRAADGSIDSPVIVDAGATLAGTGVISGNVTATDVTGAVFGSRIAPGDNAGGDAGTLHVGGDVSLNAGASTLLSSVVEPVLDLTRPEAEAYLMEGSSLAIQLAPGTTPAVPWTPSALNEIAGSDMLDVDGLLTLGEGSILDLSFVGGSAGIATEFRVLDFNLAANDLDGDGSIDSFFDIIILPMSGTDQFAIIDGGDLLPNLGENGEGLGSLLHWDLRGLYTSGVIKITPEPTTWLLAAFGLVGIFLARRRQ